MRVLAIDQSFTNCAYSIWECDKLYDFGVISSDKEQPIHLRIKFIIKELRQIIQEEQINFVVLEGLRMGGIPSVSARSLAALFYCIELLCEDEGISFENIPPKSVKKVWTGSGNASKKDMEEATPDYLLNKIMLSKYKTISGGRRDLVDSFAIYKSYCELIRDKI